MATLGDVHVGDIGTLYKARIQNAGVDFDPSAAVVKQLIFKTPDGTFTRDAQIVVESGKWYLTYTVVAGDAAELHVSRGTYSWQGYLEFGAGEKYHTNVETYVVLRNLE